MISLPKITIEYFVYYYQVLLPKGFLMLGFLQKEIMANNQNKTK